jgi:predicted ATPase/DNA-binding SARP family transcriptional activator
MGVEVQIRLLGEPGLLVDGALRRTTERETMLLALLGCRANSVVSSSSLHDAIWPDGASRSALHVLVSRVRKLLPPGAEVRLATTPVGYRLEASGERGSGAIDIAHFEAAVDEGRDLVSSGRRAEGEALLRAALDLWDEPFGVLGHHPALLVETRRLHELHADAEDALSDALLARAQPVDVARLQRLVDEAPYRERRWVHLMTALYRSGRQTDALRCAQAARRILLEEVGVEPGRELAEAVRAILAHDDSLAEPPGPETPWFRLPADVTSFVGREAERGTLRDLIKANRLVTLWGPGGVGKSRTALQVVRELAGSMRNGAVHIGMSAVEDFAAVVDLFALAIGVTRSDHHRLPMLVAHLADAECIVVFDNCEHLGHEVADLATRLLEQCPDVRVVVTSQRPLGILGEVHWRLPLMDTTRDEGPSDAERLFHERSLVEDRSTWRDEDVAALCEGLDGLPLALELAAALTRSLSPREILDRLGDRFELLAADHPTSPRHHRTLAATIEWSHSLLSAPAATLLARVSVFEGGFTLDATGSVCSGDGIDGDAVLGLVDELVSHSFLTVQPTPVGTRYHLLESILLYAHQRLEAGAELADRQARHGAYFTELARTVGRTVYLDDGDAIGVLAAEDANLRAALDHAIAAGDLDAALELANDLHGYWMLQGLTDYGRSRLEQLLSTRRATSLRTARAEMAAAILAGFDGDYGVAEERLDRAEAQFVELDLPKQVAWAAFWRGRALTAAVLAGVMPVERLEEAAAAHEQAIHFFRSIDDQVSVLAASPFAGLCGLLRRHPGGRDLIERAYAVATRLGLRRHIALSGAMLGLCLGQDGDHERAAELLSDAGATLAAAGDRLNESIVKALHAQVELAAGHLDVAARTCLDDLDLQKHHGAREWEPYVLAVAWAVLERRESERGATRGRAGAIADRLDVLLPNWTQSLVLTAVGDATSRPAPALPGRADVVVVSGLIDELSGALEATLG